MRERALAGLVENVAHGMASSTCWVLLRDSRGMTDDVA